MTSTMRSSLDRDLQNLEEELVRLGGMVDRAIELGLASLTQRNADLAQQVIDGDQVINDLRYQIEESCLRLIATQQPTAGDLRAVMAAFSIAMDLERMADHAAGISKVVLMMGDEPLLKPLIDIPRMAELCRQMIKHALKVYAGRDVASARSIALQDDQIDGLYQQIFRELLSIMVENPKTTTRALYLLFVAHNLERIGDRVTNIAERVVFMASGEVRELNPEPHDASALQ
jgi:phosphate transport system protein